MTDEDVDDQEQIHLPQATLAEEVDLAVTIARSRTREMYRIYWRLGGPQRRAQLVTEEEQRKAAALLRGAHAMTRAAAAIFAVAAERKVPSKAKESKT